MDFKKLYNNLKYVACAGLLTIAIQNCNCGESPEENNNPQDSNEITDTYHPQKDANELSDILDAGFDANQPVDTGILDANDDVPQYDAGMDASLDAAMDALYNDVPELDGGMDAELDSAIDANLNDVPQYDAAMDAELDAAIDAGYDASTDTGNDSGTDAAVQACDNLYASDYVIPSPPYIMRMPVSEFLNVFKTVTGIEKVKNLESKITSDILMQASALDASSMYEITSGDVLFEIDTGICEMNLDKTQMNTAYQGEYQ